MARSKSRLSARAAAALEIGVGVLGIDQDRLVEIGDGMVKVAAIAVGDAAIVVGEGVLRIELD